MSPTDPRRHVYRWNPNPPTGWEPEASPYPESADAGTDTDPDQPSPKF